MPPMPDRDALLAALRFQLEAGADACIADQPIDRFAARAAPPPMLAAVEPAAPVAPAAPAPARGRPAAIASALALAPTGSAAEGAAMRAAACRTIDELKAAVEAFEGCPLKDTASSTVFADGRPGSALLIMGEAPGREEDRLGLPFVGESGKLLDRMLAAIGLDRRNVFISNVIYWRPPGNRTPAQEEIMACLPFARRLIELSQPKVVLALGNAAVQTLLRRSEGITRLRGRWVDYPLESGTVPLMPSFHPAFLLRQPGLKRESWRDILAVRAKLAEAGVWPPEST